MLEYVKGDATNPIDTGHANKAILHVCNDIGLWGAGFVKALSNKWSLPEESYRAWSRGDSRELEPFALGRVQTVRLEPNLYVMNMVAQRGVVNEFNPKPIDYYYLGICLDRIAGRVLSDTTSIHMPRIGCGLAGGKWEIVESLVSAALEDFYVVVYDLD